MNTTSSLVLPVSFRIVLVKKRTLINIGMFFAIILLLFLLTIYIFQINSEVSERYLISGYEKEMAELLKGKAALETNIVQSNSLQSVFSVLESENSEFVKAEKVHHLKVKGSRVVVK